MQERDVGPPESEPAPQTVHQGKAPGSPCHSLANQLADPDCPTIKNCTRVAVRCQDDYQPTYDLDYNHTGTMT